MDSTAADVAEAAALLSVLPPRARAVVLVLLAELVERTRPPGPMSPGFAPADGSLPPAARA